MKKLFICLIATCFVSLSSFSSKDVVHAVQCNYKMYDANGQYLGNWSIWVPDNVSCGSKEAKALAIADYNVWN